MECDEFREALSARLDGEAGPGERARADAHLAGCAECRRWLEDAASVTRLVRTGPAVAGPEVSDAVLAAAPGRWRGRLTLALRVALAGLGVAQLALGTFQVRALRGGEADDLHGPALDGATPGHLWHESAAWNVAIGAAFLWVAARRGRPAALLPVLSVFLGVLMFLSVADLLGERVEAARLASHGFILAGFLIVLALSRPAFGTDAPPGMIGTRSWSRTRRREAPEPAVQFRHGRDVPAAESRRREAA